MDRTFPDFAVSIINYRTEALTIAATQSVLSDLGDRPARIVIVDNASGDGSADGIANWSAKLGDDRIKLVRSEKNGGFSSGHNQGIAAAPDADAYLILNSDALLRPGFFDAMAAEMEGSDDVGLFAPRLTWEDGTSQTSAFRFASPASELIRGAATGPVTKALSRHVVALDDPADRDRAEWVSFACVLLCGRMVRSLGPMDDGYFLYFEDAEYGLRAHRAGWKIAFVDDAVAVHHRGGSGPVKALEAQKKRLPAYYWRSRARFLRQASGPFGPLLGNLAWCLGRGIAQARRVLGRDVPPAHDNEAKDIWTGTLSPLRPDPEGRRP